MTINIHNFSQLNKEYRYVLHAADGGHIHIKISHAIEGTNQGAYRAVPERNLISAKHEYHCFGATEEEALQGLLDKISGIPFDDLF